MSVKKRTGENTENMTPFKLESIFHDADGRKFANVKETNSGRLFTEELGSIFNTSSYKKFNKKDISELSVHFYSDGKMDRDFLDSSDLRVIISFLGFFASFMLISFLISIVPDKLIHIDFNGFVVEKYFSSLISPALFLCVSMNTETLGYSSSRVLLLAMLPISLAVYLWIWLAMSIQSPQGSHWQVDDNLYLISFSHSLFTNSLLFIVFDLLNSFIVSIIKVKNIIKTPSCRIVFSSLLISTFLIISNWLILAPLVLKINTHFMDIIYSLLYNYVFIVIFAFPSAIIVSRIKKFSGIDHYDLLTDYNPFRLDI